MRRLVQWTAAAMLLMSVTACGKAEAEGLVPSLERLAEGGNAEAMYHVGMAYQTGSGVKEDKAKALDAFRKSAEKGDPLGAYKLGCYYDGQGEGLVANDAALALKYKLIAAEAGYALAQSDVASVYGRKGDVPAALKWLEAAAAQGYPGALEMLTALYYGSLPGVEPDTAKAVGYFRLFLDRTKPTDRMRDWLAKVESGLSPDEKKRADDMVRAFQPKLTPLTIKAMAGQDAAEELVKKAG